MFHLNLSGALRRKDVSASGSSVEISMPGRRALGISNGTFQWNGPGGVKWCQ
jgi:hypothetical protein